MRLEELHQQEKHNQVGVTLQRKPFETEIDIFPQLNPFSECSVGMMHDESVLCELTSAQTEERLGHVMKHHPEELDEEFRPIPLKRIDSGPYQHRLQECSEQAEEKQKPSEEEESGEESRHIMLLNEIDNSEPNLGQGKAKTTKKESTLSRMLKGIRGEKDVDDVSEKLGTNMSLSKIFHRINPVSKSSRDNFSKVFHRIGDALQKKSDEEMPPSRRKQKTLERNIRSRDGTKSMGEQKFGKIGEKMFKYRPPSSDADKSA